jgi:hypothetical protein
MYTSTKSHLKQIESRETAVIRTCPIFVGQPCIIKKTTFYYGVEAHLCCEAITMGNTGSADWCSNSGSMKPRWHRSCFYADASAMKYLLFFFGKNWCDKECKILWTQITVEIG